MINLNENILLKSRQHKLVLITNFLKNYLVFWLIITILLNVFRNINVFIKIAISISIALIIFSYSAFFWLKSYFVVTNKQIYLDVRNWIFSNFRMWIYFHNIKDMAFSKNNIFHYMFNYWTFFARSRASSNWWDFTANSVPNIEKVFWIINAIYTLKQDKRESLQNLSELEAILNINKPALSEADVIEFEKNNLLSIKWIKEVILLDWVDRKFIFDNEEDKNHWVYESLRRKVLLCVTHDDTFRDPDEPIVYKTSVKHIFPWIWFHEVKRNNVVSSSPWIVVHNYLLPKFKKLDKDDATILIWFDL